MDLVIGGRIENAWLDLYLQAFEALYVNPGKLAGKHPPAHPTPARNLFSFLPVGESALGISAATFTPGQQRAKSLTLEYYDTTGLGEFAPS